MDPAALDDKEGTGRAAWLNYSITRAAWRQALFAKKYPNETQYRHTLEEETAALSSVADAVDQSEGRFASRSATDEYCFAGSATGLLEAWVLLSGVTGSGHCQGLCRLPVGAS